MRRGKYQSKKRAKGLALLVVLTLLLGCGIGGTLAWLMDTTGPVTNTFTVGNIDIDLKEHKLVNNNLDMSKEVTEEASYKIIPGTSQPKDPFVRVKAGSEASWVFIKVEALNDANTYITYSVDNTVWTPLVDTDKDGISDNGVYYKDMPAVAGDDAYLNILTNKTVSYPGTLTKAEIDNLYKKDAEGNISTPMTPVDNLPKLQFTSYAIQKANGNGTTFTAEKAWEELNKTPATPPATDN